MEEEEGSLGALLAGSFLLVKLTVRLWSGKKTDLEASRELNASKGADADASRVIKALLAGNNAKLKDCTSAYTRLRTFFYDQTSPWTTSSAGAKKGDRLVATAASIEFLTEFACREKEAVKARLAFVNDYDNAVKNAVGSQGALYDASHYPTKEAVAELFGSSLSMNPLPDGIDFDRIAGVPAEFVVGLKNAYESNQENQLSVALQDVQFRILEELERTQKQLSKVVAGEDTRLFKTMVTNLQHLVGMARSLNVAADNEITEIADTIEEHLLSLEVSSYKENVPLARANSNIAKGIETRINKGTWGSTNEIVKEETNSITPEVTATATATTVVVEPEVEVEPVNEQLEKDQEFLASLMTKIGDPDEKTPEVEEEEVEETQPIADPATPDFDPDDVMFK